MLKGVCGMSVRLVLKTKAEAGKYGVVVVVGGERCWLTRAGGLQARILEEMRSSQRIVGNHCAHGDSGESSWLRAKEGVADVAVVVVVVEVKVGTRKGGAASRRSVGRW